MLRGDSLPVLPGGFTLSIVAGPVQTTTGMLNRTALLEDVLSRWRPGSSAAEEASNFLVGADFEDLASPNGVFPRELAR